MSVKKIIGTIEVYTDGSYRKSKYGEACGYGIYFPNKELKNVAAPFTKGKLTNNRAELYAIYQAIIKIRKKYKFDMIKIYTDSQYSMKSLTEWIIKWKKNNWKKANNKPVDNQDIIKKIDKYLQKYKNKIIISWVKAHTGIDDNNSKADKLANLGADKYVEKYW